jgi:cell shape-determining protein MreC
MPAFAPEPERSGGRRQVVLAAIFVLVALSMSYLPDGARQGVAWLLRSSLLRPFVATQEGLAAYRLRALRLEVLQARLDSLTTTLATERALADENRTLRALIGLSARVGPSFRPASVLRPGTPGSEGTFLVGLGAADGVTSGAPVVDPYGLVGRIREVHAHTSVGIDWTHPDFRASAMVVDGTAFGLVEDRRGSFREADRMVLNGLAYHESVPNGTAVVTSGLGGQFPRGIPIGRIDGVADSTAGWLKSYWLKPMVQPASVTHVLVGVGKETVDLTRAWPADSIRTRAEVLEQARAQSDSLRALADSVRLLHARVEQLLQRDAGGTAPSKGAAGGGP